MNTKNAGEHGFDESAAKELLRTVQTKVARLRDGVDFYWEGSHMVFTAQFHLQRGYCCGSGCRHCPYEPAWTKGTTTIHQEHTSTSLVVDGTD